MKRPWPRPPPPSPAPPAAPPIANGPAAAMPAARGTPSSKRRPCPPAPRRLGGKGRAHPADRPCDRGSRRRPAPSSGIDELDRVLGGGLVPASAILVGGDPGIGKSTLLLQAAAALPARGLKCLYISGEEAAAQVRMRAQRLGLADAPVALGRRNQPARHPDHAGRRTPRPCDHRFDPDHVAGYRR